MTQLSNPKLSILKAGIIVQTFTIGSSGACAFVQPGLEPIHANIRVRLQTNESGKVIALNSIVLCLHGNVVDDNCYVQKERPGQASARVPMQSHTGYDIGNNSYFVLKGNGYILTTHTWRQETEG